MEPPKPTIVAHLYPDMLSELLGLLSGLPPEDWDRPTVCAGWSVGDVALHLLGEEIGNLSRRRDGHSLDPSVSGWGELVAHVNEWNESWVRAARRISPRLVINWLEFTGVQACTYFLSLDPWAIGGPVSWAGPDPVPVWLDLAREYTERWHHQQHIRDAVGKPGLKQPRYPAPVLSSLVWALPHSFRSTRAAEGTPMTLTITGESGGQWCLLRQGEEWALVQGAPVQAAAEVVIDEDAAWRLFTRGLTRDTARSVVSCRGDQALGAKVLEVVSIIA